MRVSRLLGVDPDRPAESVGLHHRADASGKDRLLRVGLIGFGNSARHVAKAAAGFGMRVLFTDPFVKQGQFDAPGDKVVLLGGNPALQAWNKQAAIELATTEDDFPWWTAEVQLPPGEPLEYKFAIRRCTARGPVFVCVRCLTRRNACAPCYQHPLVLRRHMGGRTLAMPMHNSARR